MSARDLSSEVFIVAYVLGHVLASYLSRSTVMLPETSSSVSSISHWARRYCFSWYLWITTCQYFPEAILGIAISSRDNCRDWKASRSTGTSCAVFSAAGATRGHHYARADCLSEDLGRRVVGCSNKAGTMSSQVTHNRAYASLQTKLILSSPSSSLSLLSMIRVSFVGMTIRALSGGVSLSAW